MIKMSNNTIDDISKDSNYTSLFESNVDDETIKILFDFYLYKIANGSDSPLSMRIDILLSDEQKDLLFNQLLVDANINKDDILFSSFLVHEIKTIRIMELSDTTLRCDRIKGFFHQTANGRTSQHKLDSMFKHIRNSFAHGRISTTSAFLILEDKRNTLTSRFIVTLDVLQKWKDRIEKFVS